MKVLNGAAQDGSDGRITATAHFEGISCVEHRISSMFGIWNLECFSLRFPSLLRVMGRIYGQGWRWSVAMLLRRLIYENFQALNASTPQLWTFHVLENPGSFGFPKCATVFE